MSVFWDKSGLQKIAKVKSREFDGICFAFTSCFRAALYCRQSQRTDGALRPTEIPHCRRQSVAAETGGRADAASGRVMDFKNP